MASPGEIIIFIIEICKTHDESQAVFIPTSHTLSIQAFYSMMSTWKMYAFVFTILLYYYRRLPTLPTFLSHRRML